MSKLLSIVLWFESARHRGLAYRAALVVGPILVVAGVLTSGTESQVLYIAGVLLGVSGNGLATKHTSIRRT